MARSNALLLFLLALSCGWSWCSATTAAAGGGFITSWCEGTDYPALCNATLAPYAAEVGASPARLSLAALTVTLDGARKAAAAMKAMAAAGASRSHHLLVPPVAAQAAEDCVGMLEDAVDLLRQSVEAMERLGKEEPSGVSGQQGGSGSSRSVRFQVNSVQTWASAALTNDDMCMEGFKGQAAVVREAVEGNVTGAMHLTANALAIVNAMARQI